MPGIIVDQTVLHQKSKLITRGELDEVLKELFDSIPHDSLGLSGPQIGLFKRIFLANLSSGHLAFVNPEITWTSKDQVPSVESCLSLPDVIRCVNRYSQISIKVDTLIHIPSLTVYVPFEFKDNPEPIRLKSRDAFIVQHELDHLNGILLIDHPRAETSGQKIHQRDMNRRKRIEANRKRQISMRTPSSNSQKTNPKKAIKRKRLARSASRQEKIRVKIQEKYRAAKEGLFSDPPSDLKESSKTQK